MRVRAAYPARVVTATARALIAVWILFLLVRAGATAWGQRRLVLAVWRRIRPRHVLGAVGLLVLVGGLATVLLVWVPGMSYGLGSLVGLTGNAVFAPLEEAAAHSAAAATPQRDWLLAGLSVLFLGGLAAMLPWLAFVEEEMFRAGLEDASLPRQAWRAFVFGLAHLVMLVPVGAALAVGTAGFVYGRIYRRAYRRSEAAPPRAVAAAFRPTRASAAAADRSRTESWSESWSVAGTAVAGDGSVAVLVDRTPERRQADAVLASTVWHATFNTVVVVLVLVSIVVSALFPGA